MQNKVNFEFYMNAASDLSIHQTATNDTFNDRTDSPPGSNRSRANLSRYTIHEWAPI